MFSTSSKASLICVLLFRPIVTVKTFRSIFSSLNALSTLEIKSSVREKFLNQIFFNVKVVTEFSFAVFTVND